MAGTLAELCEIFTAPERLSRDEMGRPYLVVEVWRPYLAGNGFPWNVITDMKDLGFEVTWSEDQQTATVTRGDSTGVPAEYGPGTRPVTKNDFVRDSKPSPAELAPFALWLFEHYVYGIVGRGCTDDSAVERPYPFRAQRQDESDAMFWNALAAGVEVWNFDVFKVGLAQYRWQTSRADALLTLGRSVPTNVRYLW